MAKFQDGNYGTAAGVTLIAKVLAGRCTLKYTRAAVGKGAIPDGSTPKTMTGPADYVMDVPISGVTNPVDGECQVSVQVSSANVQTGFYCTNVVLYAQDPDVGEVPFTYLVLENEPEWIHPASSSVGKVTAIDLISAVGDVDRVEATIDESTIATIKAATELIKEHDKDPDAHAATIKAAVRTTVKTLSESGEILNEEQVKALIKEQVDGGTGGGYYGSYELTLAADGWKPARSEDDYENAGGMDYYQCIYDAELSDSTSELVPVGVVSPGSFYTTTKAGVLNGCETHDGFIRFFAQRIPEADIQATVTLFGKGGGSGETGSVSIGQGLKRDASGAIAVRIGEGLDFDSANALTVRKETVVTSEDLLDEEETQQEIVDMLK